MKPLLPWFAGLFVMASGLVGAHAAESSPSKVPPLPCNGKSSCQMDGFSVQAGDCGDNSSFGAISAPQGSDGVDLNDRIDGKGLAVARLKDSQFVCIAAIARRGDVQRHYVIAVPTTSVPACKGKELCRNADHPVTWYTAKTGKSCHRVGEGRYAGDCAAGWVDEGALDQYANGF